MIDNQVTYRVKLIAQIMAKNPQATVVTLDLDDGTGRIDAKFWLQQSESEDGEEQMQDTESASWLEGSYVRVFGQIRQIRGSERTSIFAQSIQPITDFNEITFHMLEVIYVHLYFLRSSGGAQVAQVHNPYEQQAQTDGSFTNLHQTVLDIVARYGSSSSEGVSIGFIVQQLSGYQNITEDDIREAISYLSSEGHLYSTYDEEHFKASVEG